MGSWNGGDWGECRYCKTNQCDHSWYGDTTGLEMNNEECMNCGMCVYKSNQEETHYVKLSLDQVNDHRSEYYDLQKLTEKEYEHYGNL